MRCLLWTNLFCSLWHCCGLGGIQVMVINEHRSPRHYLMYQAGESCIWRQLNDNFRYERYHITLYLADIKHLR
jgi:hypothetical protein